MGLPLVPEIREARTHVLDAQRASLDLAETDGAVAALELAGRRGDRSAPGILELCDRLAGGWPLAPRPEGHDPATLVAWLDQARRHLRPVARSLVRRVEEMQELQLRQQDAMATSEHAALAERIHTAVHRRDDLVATLIPVDQQIGVIEPCVQLIGTFVRRIEEAETEAEPEHLPGSGAWRASGLATAFVASLGSVLDEVEQGLPIPAPPVTAPAASIATAAAHREGARRAREELNLLREALVERLRSLREASAAHRAEREELDRWLLEVMG